MPIVPRDANMLRNTTLDPSPIPANPPPESKSGTESTLAYMTPEALRTSDWPALIATPDFSYDSPSFAQREALEESHARHAFEQCLTRNDEGTYFLNIAGNRLFVEAFIRGPFRQIAWEEASQEKDESQRGSYRISSYKTPPEQTAQTVLDRISTAQESDSVTSSHLFSYHFVKQVIEHGLLASVLNGIQWLTINKDPQHKEYLSQHVETLGGLEYGIGKILLGNISKINPEYLTRVVTWISINIQTGGNSTLPASPTSPTMP